MTDLIHVELHFDSDDHHSHQKTLLPTVPRAGETIGREDTDWIVDEVIWLEPDPLDGSDARFTVVILASPK